MKRILTICCMLLCGTILCPQSLKDGQGVPSRRYVLRGGYELSIIDTQKDGYHICRITLSRDGRNIPVWEGAYADNLKYYPRYENIDFDDYVVLTFYFGDYVHCLYEKKSGIKVLEADNAVFNLEHQLVIFSTCKITTGERLGLTDEFLPRNIVLYDLENGKKYMLNEYLYQEWSKAAFWLKTSHWYHSFRYGEITDNSIEIIFFGCYKPIFNEHGEFVDTENYQFTFEVAR